MVNHKPTEINLRRDTVVKNFKLEFDDIKERKEK